MCMIATTIISSINVNPKLMRFIPPSYPVRFYPVSVHLYASVNKLTPLLFESYIGRVEITQYGNQ